MKKYKHIPSGKTFDQNPSDDSETYRESVSDVAYKIPSYFFEGKDWELVVDPNFTQVCLWPGTIIGAENVNEFEGFLLSEMNARVKYLEEVKTLPDEGGEGGRNDVFFSVHKDDIGHFAVPRLKLGIRWWEDVLGNGGGCLYPAEVLKRYTRTW